MTKKRRLTKVEKRQRRKLLAQRRQPASPRPKRMPYSEYLASDLWKEIRARVLARDRYLCQACFEKAEQVHHKDYRDATMQDLCLDGLIPLCRKCHVKIELENDQTSGPKQANIKLRVLMRLRWVEVMAKHRSPPPALSTAKYRPVGRKQDQ